MPKYRVRIVYEYPVDAVNAEDAFATIPIATRLKYLNADGTTEIINSEGKVVLKAKLVNKNSKEACEQDVKAEELGKNER